METSTPIMPPLPQPPVPDERPVSPDDAWVSNAALLWENRHLLARVLIVTIIVSTLVVFLLPKQYESTTRIMPPEQSSGGTALLAAALSGKTSGTSSLASLAGGLLGARGNGALFISLLHSGTISGHLIDRFQLQHVYRKRYLEDTAKKLAKKTTVTEDMKSGVITIVVEDKDRARARDMAQAYVDELNILVARVNTSSARREREFIEQRLLAVGHDLQQAELDLSAFSTKNATIDIKEQTRAMVDAGARLQGELVVSQSELQSLQQIYGAQNVRVRAAEARIAVLRRELARESNGTNLPAGDESTDNPLAYPALRQLPALAVPWANLYRRVRIQETVYELLSAQYETARIDEAKSIATVRVIDPAGWPEKKSSPHRLIIILVSTALAFGLVSFYLLMRRSWRALHATDTRKILGRQIASSLTSTFAERGSR